MAKQLDFTAAESINIDESDGVVEIEDDETDTTVEVIEIDDETDTTVEIIEIDDDTDEGLPEVIEIDDDEILELTESGSVHEHRGQHISITSGITCEKCAKLGDFDLSTEEHLGCHFLCKKCDDIS